MKNSSDMHLLENKVFTRVMAAVLGLFGLTLFSVTARLWHWLSAGMISMTLIYGCVLLFAALYAWRIESSEVTNKLHTACFWLMSAGMIGVVTFALMTKPSVLDLPFHHPKPLSCLAMLTSATIFAYKAWKRR
jgi:hypothetical protein